MNENNDNEPLPGFIGDAPKPLELGELELLRQSIKEADDGKTVPMRLAVERLGKK
jgi:hypothetical protein